MTRFRGWTSGHERILILVRSSDETRSVQRFVGRDDSRGPRVRVKNDTGETVAKTFTDERKRRTGTNPPRRVLKTVLIYRFSVRRT